MSRPRDSSDRYPCEWNPDQDRELWISEEPHADATVILGRDRNWMLCASCAELPRFSRYAIREQLVKKPKRRKATGKTGKKPKAPHQGSPTGA